MTDNNKSNTSANTSAVETITANELPFNFETFFNKAHSIFNFSNLLLYPPVIYSIPSVNVEIIECIAPTEPTEVIQEFNGLRNQINILTTNQSLPIHGDLLNEIIRHKSYILSSYSWLYEGIHSKNSN